LKFLKVLEIFQNVTQKRYKNGAVTPDLCGTTWNTGYPIKPKDLQIAI